MQIRIHKGLVQPLKDEALAQDRSHAKITNMALRVYLTRAGRKVSAALKKP